MTLSGELGAALDSFVAREQILVATDFDGVLAPLVDDPSASKPIAGSVAALRGLASAPGVFVAIVSGRHLAALRQVSGVVAGDGIVLIGSHGAEPDRELALDVQLDDAARERLRRATDAVQGVADRYPPARIERKPAGVVLHTRRADPEIAARASGAALAIAIPGIDVMLGKDIVEFSALPVTKGTALQALARHFGTTATLYLGDDVTDERAFEVLAGDPANVTVKVGAGDTRARFRIDGSPEVLELLHHLHRPHHMHHPHHSH